MVYLPKLGKGPYSSPRDFTQISLSSFLLKTLERLLDRDISDGAQHAYPTSKSVETALHQLVYRLTGVLEHKGLAMECLCSCRLALHGHV